MGNYSKPLEEYLCCFVRKKRCRKIGLQKTLMDFSAFSVEFLITKISRSVSTEKKKLYVVALIVTCL